MCSKMAVRGWDDCELMQKMRKACWMDGLVTCIEAAWPFTASLSEQTMGLGRFSVLCARCRSKLNQSPDSWLTSINVGGVFTWVGHETVDKTHKALTIWMHILTVYRFPFHSSACICCRLALPADAWSGSVWYFYICLICLTYSLICKQLDSCPFNAFHRHTKICQNAFCFLV